MSTYWGAIGVGKAEGFPPNAYGIFDPIGGGGGGREIIIFGFEFGFIGAAALRDGFGLGGRLSLKTNKIIVYLKKKIKFTS